VYDQPGVVRFVECGKAPELFQSMLAMKKCKVAVFAVVLQSSNMRKAVINIIKRKQNTF
jgi:hypothetical protein